MMEFDGYHLPVTFVLREENRAIERDGETVVVGMMSLAVSVNGSLAYVASEPYPHSLGTFTKVPQIVDSLLTHRVRWWVSEAWQDHPVYYRGTPGYVVAYRPAGGIATIEAEEGWAFPLTGPQRESGIEDDDEDANLTVIQVAVLESTDVDWDRARAFEADDEPSVPPAVQTEGGHNGEAQVAE